MRFLSPLSEALNKSGIDFNLLLEPLLVKPPQGGPPALMLAGYFRLLERIAEETGDEALNLSSRPLLPGTLQFALSQALAANTLEEAMHKIATSFNLFHGGQYNHVYVRDHCLVYEINIDSFPYPIEVKRPEQDSLLECILVLMHFMFVYLTSETLDDLLVRVRTRRKLDGKPDASSQLGYWSVPRRRQSGPVFPCIMIIPPRCCQSQSALIICPTPVPCIAWLLTMSAIAQKRRTRR